jgi:peptidoglycan/xylan/chitin deacetylase (PgdA/CDA1 family)
MVPAKTPRLVQLLGKGLQFRIETKEPVVYLTFDDGPIPGLTPWISDQLNYWGAKATFFMVGENILRQPSLVESLLKSGHALGNHTHNHLNGFKTRVSDYLANADACQQALESFLPQGQPLLFRPPYGKISPRELFFLRKLGYHIVMWDVLSKDYDAEVPPNQVVQNVLDHAEPGSIIVLHDNLKAEANLKIALPRILAGLRQKGFRMENLWSALADSLS